MTSGQMLREMIQDAVAGMDELEKSYVREWLGYCGDILSSHKGEGKLYIDYRWDCDKNDNERFYVVLNIRGVEVDNEILSYPTNPKKASQTEARIDGAAYVLNKGLELLDDAEWSDFF